MYRAFKEYKNEIEGKSSDTLDKDIPNIKDSTAYQMLVKDSIPATKDTNSVKAKKEILFKVQFATSPIKKSLTSPDFKGLKDVQEYFHNGLYKYVAGNETTFEAALLCLDKVHDLGFKDAFVVAFLNGERISPQEAVKLIKKN